MTKLQFISECFWILTGKEQGLWQVWDLKHSEDLNSFTVIQMKLLLRIHLGNILCLYVPCACAKLRNVSKSGKGCVFIFCNRGLGLERIFVNFLKVYCDVANLVLVLNTTQLEEVGVCIFLNSFFISSCYANCRKQ